MNKKLFGALLVVVFFLHNCNSSQSLTIKNVNDAASCVTKDGYWYQGKCWADYEDEGISKSEIDQVVEEEMQFINTARININDSDFPIEFFFPIPEGSEVIFLTVYEDIDGPKSLIQSIPIRKLEGKGVFQSEATLMVGNLITADEGDEVNTLASGPVQVEILDEETLSLRFSGSLSNDAGTMYNIEMQANEALGGAGNSTMEVKGTEVHINGDLGTRTYHQLKGILSNHPEVKTVVLGQISGSVNDAVNMHTGRLLREAGLNTKVLADSEIASGGVDLFCAGVERIVEQGARIGIHSWCCVGELTAIDLPKDHPAHKYQIEFFTMCMGAKDGPAFYFHTLEAAPFDDIYWMSDEGIKNWKVATQLLPTP